MENFSYSPPDPSKRYGRSLVLTPQAGVFVHGGLVLVDGTFWGFSLRLLEEFLLEGYELYTHMDHASGFSFVFHQTSISSEETVKSKLAFEKFAASHGVNIKHYHADNGRFKNNPFMKSKEEKGQTICFCGVGASSKW
jgi:hypothetical protein